jgi:organic hydroperoxide reductase OsmC/OhrA
LSSERSVFVTHLNRVRDYQFKVKFDLPGIPELLVDESEPLGKNAGPNPSRLLSAAVGDCLSSSLVFCLSKGRIAVNDLKTSVETVVQRNEKGRWRIAALKVKLHPVIREEDVPRSKRCLELFEDFCVVTESVRNGIDVNVDVEMGSSGSDGASASA